MTYTQDDLNTAIATQEHYERMIAWVKTQPKTDPVRDYAMYNAIKESWDSLGCPCCQQTNTYCDVCLFTRALNSTCGEVGWSSLDYAYCWADWLVSARFLLRNIKKMRKIIEKEMPYAQ